MCSSADSILSHIVCLLVTSPRIFFPTVFQYTFLLIIQISIQMSPTQRASNKVVLDQSPLYHFCVLVLLNQYVIYSVMLITLLQMVHNGRTNQLIKY